MIAAIITQLLKFRYNTNGFKLLKFYLLTLKENKYFQIRCQNVVILIRYHSIEKDLDNGISFMHESFKSLCNLSYKNATKEVMQDN